MSDQTTRELAREVAIAVGYSVYKRVESFTLDDLYMLVAPHPEREYTLSDYSFLIRMGGDYASRKTEAEAWQDAPDYPHDLNACARDLTVEGYRVVLKQMVDGWEVDYYIEDQIDTLYGEPFVYAANEQPAVAWCEAFLALCKYVEAKGEGDDLSNANRIG